MFSPFTIANWFITNTDSEEGDVLTHLKLQKLLYYAQAWCLVLYDRPLFEEDFQAWTHGPVLPSLFAQLKGLGVAPIPDTLNVQEEQLGEEEINVLSQVNAVYGSKTAIYLRNLTHREDPWNIARGGIPDELRSDNIIHKDLMLEYYSGLLKKHGQEG